MGYQLGIDIGTTYTAAAVCRSSDHRWVEPETVTLGTRSATIPSVLFIAAGRWRRRRRGGGAPRADRSRTGWSASSSAASATPPRSSSAGSRGRPRTSPRGSSAGSSTGWPSAKAAPRRSIALTHPASWGSHKKELLVNALSGAGPDGLVPGRAAGRRAALRHGGAGGPRLHHRGLRPRRRHVRRGGRAQGRPVRRGVRRCRVRAAGAPGGPGPARRRRLRRGRVRARPRRAARGLRRPGRHRSARAVGRRPRAPGVHRGQGGALGRHRRLDPGAPARRERLGAAAPQRVRRPHPRAGGGDGRGAAQGGEVGRVRARRP